MSALANRETSILAIIAAVLLPPLGVFLVRGIGRDFWISVVLTLIAWVPGVLFALIAILRPDLIGSERL